MSSWLAPLKREDVVRVKIVEVRFTQSTVKLHRVAISLSAGPQHFISQAIAPTPVDPVSHRYRVSWPDSDLQVPLTRYAPGEAELVVYDRRRRQRIALGTVVISLYPRNDGVYSMVQTLRMADGIFPALNIKVDVEITIDAPVEIVNDWVSMSVRHHHGAPMGLYPSATGSHLSTLASTGAYESDIASSIIPDINSTSESRLNGKNITSLGLESGTGTGIGPGPGSGSGSGSGTSPTINESTPSLIDEGVSSMAPTVVYHADKARWSQFGFDINSNTVGVTFLEIQSISNLPRFRTLTGLSFDMDPFVVVSFGQRTFRTPYRRHTTNPTFNSKIVFDVGKHESNFNITFDVWDKDKITLNDHVAQAVVALPRIIERGPATDPETGLFILDTYEPEAYVLPLESMTTEKSTHSSVKANLKIANLRAGSGISLRRSTSLTGAEMLIRVHYYPLAAIRQQLWRGVISLYDSADRGGLQRDQFCAMLNSLGSTLKSSTIDQMFLSCKKDPCKGLLATDEIVLGLEKLIEQGVGSSSESAERVILFRICPMCQQQPSTQENSQTKSLLHLSVCASRHWGRGITVPSALLDSRYVSSQQASRRWYVKFLSKFSYGSYELGAHSANILVQDRITGQISEEKMSAYVRLGIRVLYAVGPVETQKFKRMLKKYTVKHGIKYSSTASASQIGPFIKFHHLDMSEVQDPVSSFKTFNEFFYRKLIPGARPCENSEEPRTVVSCADCRLTVFQSVDAATRLWIKGKGFTVKQLLGPDLVDDAKVYSNESSVLVFRLAPQDYHRVHVPVDGIVGESVHIPGQYYTVNPMAVRSGLDVFGVNARTIVPIQSEHFGKVMVVLVGAMMVGSIVVTAQPGSHVKRTDELGYFQFGGSTVVLLFEPGRIVLDSDLVANSERAIESLVRVGMSVGHTADIPEYTRSYDTRWNTIKRARTRIAGGGAYLPFSLD